MSIDGEIMRIWTIQPLDVVDIIKRKGYFICDIKKSEYYTETSFINAYNWLNKEMCKRIGSPPKGVTYPIWAWYSRDGKHKKPDLRESAYAQRGTMCACIELEIDESRVLLHDYDDWHFVLNNWYLFYPLNEEEYQKGTDYFESLPENYQEKVREKSWEHIFDLRKIDNPWTKRGYYIQATFWVLYKKDIVNIQYFKAR